MNESGSNNGGSYIHNALISWKNKVFSPKVQASFNSNMAAVPAPPPQERSLDIVKLDAREVAMDIVHYVSGYQVQPPPSEHARTMRRCVDEMRERHQILFNSMRDRLGLPTEAEDPGNQQSVKDILYRVYDEMLRDGEKNWGRVVSIHTFGGVVAKYFVDNDMHDYVHFLGQCITDYTCDKLANWMLGKGGWDSFDNQFLDLGRRLEDQLWKGFLIFGGIGAVALGVVAAR